MTAAPERSAFASGRFRLLLLALLVFLIGTAAAPHAVPARLVEFILMAIGLGVAVFELRTPGQRRLVPLTLAASVILLSVVDYTMPLRHLPLIASAIVAVFAGMVVWLVYGSVMRPHRPIGDRIVGAVCVYILIGLGWASVYEALDGVIPGSLRFPTGTAWMTPSPVGYRYFSFVTLATLGYGDVTPVTALMGTLASIEAIGGQLYIGITVARLVALSLMDRSDSSGSSRPDI